MSEVNTVSNNDGLNPSEDNTDSNNNNGQSDSSQPQISQPQMKTKQFTIKIEGTYTYNPEDASNGTFTISNTDNLHNLEISDNGSNPVIYNIGLKNEGKSLEAIQDSKPNPSENNNITEGGRRTRRKRMNKHRRSNRMRKTRK